jgi:hypothetical protein
MTTTPTDVAEDLGVAALAGYLGTEAMEPVSQKLGMSLDSGQFDRAAPVFRYGFSAPNRAYPPATHLRGFAAHLAFGLAVAAATESAWCLRGRRPGRAVTRRCRGGS